jgi:hypothetical protein
MSNTKTVMSQAANTQGIPLLDITNVFSTYLYTGTSPSTQTITNGIDLAGDGGLVWLKTRSGAGGNLLYDTERGVSKFVNTNYDGGETTGSGVSSFNTDGFSLGTALANDSSVRHVSWTFRKAPKFFDVVTWTGNGVAGRTISHNLGSAPGCIMVKRTDSTNSWNVYHRGIASDAETDYLTLNLTSAAIDSSGKWNDTAPTSSVFTVGPDSTVNANGGTYVAYLFAHNDGDGEFGPDSDQDIIKCGSYTGNGSTTGPVIDLGFEPQWLLIKNASASANWELVDNMRDFRSPKINVGLQALNPNLSDAEAEGRAYGATATGFSIVDNHADVNALNNKYIYIAIRRGPLAPPESATEVFDVSTRNASEPAYTSGFPVDFAFARAKNISNNWDTGSRLQQGNRMFTNLTNAEASNSNMMFDYQEGWSAGTGASTDYLSWMWKRAPNYFDVVAYTGNSTAGHTVSHNLGVAPEMIWVKKRNSSSNSNWKVYHASNGNNYHMFLNLTSKGATSAGSWNNTTPTESVFTLGTQQDVNNSGDTYIAYLFASLDGVSKCGGYTGNGAGEYVTGGSSQTIDCGFTSGARFVLIKSTSIASNDWHVWDTTRGIISGNDPHLSLNTTAAEVTSDDSVDANSSGFTVNQVAATNVNASGETYIFYAIA